VKIFRLFAVALLAVLPFAGNANAATFVVNTNTVGAYTTTNVDFTSILNAGDSGNLITTQTSLTPALQGTYDYIVTGVLNGMTEMTFTLVLNAPTVADVTFRDVDARLGTDLGGTAADQAAAGVAMLAQTFTDLLSTEVIGTNPVTGDATFTYTYSFMNLNHSALSFSSEMLAIIALAHGAACCSSLCLSYSVTAIPLPAAFPLFAYGLTALSGAGFIARRKKA